MLIYSKKVDEKMKLFGTLNNIPSDDDELLTYTDGEGKEVEPALSLSQSFVDGGKHSIKRVEDGKEIKAFIGDVNVIPGESSPVPPTPASNPYLTFSSAEPFSVSTTSGSKSWDGTIEYSTDTENWSEWDGTSVNSSAGGKLYFRGSNNSVISAISFEEPPNSWVLNGSAVSCTGNIETLLDYQTVESGEHPQMGVGCYGGIFSSCASLTTAPELPSTTLAEGCYSNMFANCISLTTAPELPATILALGCYAGMFQGCTSLTTSPQLPTTVLAEACYAGMFSGCTSFTTAPELSATTLAGYCYQNMFEGCTSLTTAPELPATTLADYCYQSMFSGCNSLITATELPATTLAESCYNNMFKGCTSLTSVPELPATTLADYCYNMMFYDCTSIKLSETQTTDYTTAYRIPKEGAGIDATQALTSIFTNTGGTFTGNPTINTTYYLHKDNHIV